EDTPISGTLTGADADGDSLTFALFGTPTGGNASVSSNGSFTFTPAANYNGPASFQLIVSDGTLTRAPATFTIHVTAVNDAPVAANDSHTTAEDMPLAFAAPGVLANDTDVDSASLTAVLITGPAHGTLTLNSNGSFNYAPAADYFGADSFSYKA